MAIYCVSLILRHCSVRQVRLWPTHQLIGVARSRSLFVVTPPLILPRVKARGRLVAAYAVGNGLRPFPTKDFDGPRKRDFADSTCICLPARSRFGEGRALFEQPG